MPLMMSIMDDLSGKGFPVSRTFLELWSRVRFEESFLVLNRPDEMAFHAGFEGQRAVRTWKDRMQRLASLGFISVKSGPLGDLSYAVIHNPYHVVKRAHLAGLVQDQKWQSLIVRANEVSAFDVDDLDEAGAFTDDEEEEEEDADETKPASSALPLKKPKGLAAGKKAPVALRPSRRLTRKTKSS